MSDLLGGKWSPIGWVVAFIEARQQAVFDALQPWRLGLGQELVISGPAPYPECLSLLEPLEHPWTKELLIDCGGWTAYLNNASDGGDPTAAAEYLARRLQVRCVNAMNTPLHGPGHAATQLWVSGPGGTPPLMYLRTISAHAEDGRWTWATTGDLLPFEEPERYEAKRIRDRFDRESLVRYLESLGVMVDEEEWFGSGVAIQQVVTWPTNPVDRHAALQRLAVAE